MITTYKDLEAYKKSYKLVKEVYKITNGFPHEELYGITSQLRRAAVSIPANIAEGYMRGTKEYVQFLKIALGSCAEGETLLSLCRDLGYCTSEDFNRINDLNLESMKLLTTYINKIHLRLN